jgi:NAD(P)-dependent dehydrogenase (short-subunit alcohol dehydrogenase family)
VSLEDTTLGVFRRQIETSFLGTIYVTKAAVPILREQGQRGVATPDRGRHEVGSPQPVR